MIPITGKNINLICCYSGANFLKTPQLID